MINVLHIVSDQHLAECMGCEGHPQAITPHLDALANMGMRFTSAYTQSPICTPSRVSFMSGQYCHNHGYYGLYGPCPDKLPSVMGAFRQNGYRTGAIGKLHFPNDPINWISRDCDYSTTAYARTLNNKNRRGIMSDYYAYLDALGLKDKEDSVVFPENGHALDDARPSNIEYRHSPEGWCVTETKRFLDDCGDEPFYAHVALVRPHTVLSPAQEFWDMYPDDLALPANAFNSAAHRSPAFQELLRQCRESEGVFEPRGSEHALRRIWKGYLACITQVDYAVGEMIGYLEKTGKLENTVVVYHADHGGYMSSFGMHEKVPGICSEKVCRTPMIWAGPGVESAAVCDELVELVDLPDTVCAMAGLEKMDTTDGCDITSLLRGQNEPVREIAVTENPWTKSVRWRNYRFTHYPEKMFDKDFGELYDVISDPDETRNLYFESECQDLVNKMRKMLLEWVIETTRHVTAWSSLYHPKKDYKIAADGKESNTHGIHSRMEKGLIYYL